MKNQIVRPMFTTPFFFGEIEYDYEIPTEGFVDGHNREGVVSPNVINLDLPELEEKILECAKYLISEVGFVDQPMKVNQLWLNAYDETRSGLPVHWHQNCSWSGTYFPVDANHTTWYVNPNSVYQNAYLPDNRVEEGQKVFSDFNSDYFPLTQMKKGMLLIHPSWIGHSVTWNGGEPSYSISFDIAYTGPIGSKEYGSYNDGT